MRDDSLIQRGLAVYGSFVRVTHPNESEIGYLGSFIDDHTVALETQTEAETVHFCTRMTPFDASTDAELRRSGNAVNVYLDSRLVRTAEWRGHPGEWALTVPLARGFLEITADAETPLPEITLISSNGTHQ